MSRSGTLTKQQLENIKGFRYKTCGLTPLEIYVYEYWWNFLGNKCLPDWLAPNALTLLGLVFPLITLGTVIYLDPTFSQTLPWWVYFLSWFADFWYQTVDAIDGKQARRTDNCSPLGQILDHNLDQITFTCMMIHICSALQINHDIVRIIAITPGVFSAHYSIEYRTHFTHMHQTVIGLIGATEQLLFVQIGILLCAYDPDFLQRAVTVPYIEWATTTGDIAIIFCCVTGVHFNLENMLRAFFTASDKGYALGCLLPYVQFFVMMIASSYSHLYEAYPLYFILLCGFYLTWVTAVFNLCSTAGAIFNWFYPEPFLYLLIVYLDNSATIDLSLSAVLYIGFFLSIIVRYLLLMNNIQHQICSYMGLRFLRVKDKDLTKKKN